MGARPSTFKRGGGGYLAQGEVTLVGYQFILGDEVTIGKGDRKGETMQFLNLNLDFKEDGSSEIKSRKLTIGGSAPYGEISEDGLTLEDPAGRGLGNDEAGKFISSLCDSPNFPEDRFDEDPTSINLEPMIGARLKLHWVDNPEKTAKQGPQIDAKGNKWPRRDLMVLEVLGVAAAGKAGKSAKPGKAAVVDVQAGADEVVAALVEKAGGTLKRAALSAKLQVSKSKYPQFNGEWANVVKLVMDGEYLVDADERGVIGYNAKTQTITAAA